MSRCWYPGGDISSFPVSACRGDCGYRTPEPLSAFAALNISARSAPGAWISYGAGPRPCGVTLAYSGDEGVSAGVTGSGGPGAVVGCIGLVTSVSLAVLPAVVA